MHLLDVMRRAHAKALLVSFDSNNDGLAHAEALTREVQATFRYTACRQGM